MTTVVDSSYDHSPSPKETKWKINRSKQDSEIRHLNLLTSPEFIDMYNHFMNGVDRADQIRTYYRTNRRNYRPWRPLWKLPVLNNNLQRCSNLDGSRSPNKEERKFCTKLTTQLMGQLSSFKHASP